MNNFLKIRTHAVAPLLLLTIILLCSSALPASAQENATPPLGPEQNTANQSGDLIRQLGLTQDQLSRIRAIREQNKDERQAANERLKNAQRALDEAIYSDDASEALIEERARELATAQAASVRLRALTELSIRRILTPEQLGTLRALRLRQAQQRRLERELNLRSRLRNRPNGNNDAQQQPFPRDRFRQRENAPGQPNENNRTQVGPRERRPDVAPKQRP
ncbi:MAG TPA: Spy/CpxP family protein refolding chaperone [Pyrinomonadaceae bacterium]|jgi:Spy/CpxP family protein refolding chaperone